MRQLEPWDKTMAAETHGSDLTEWVLAALAGIVTLGTATAGFLWSQISSLRREVRSNANQASKDRLDDDRRYATNEDLRQLGDDINGAMERMEGRLMQAITNRGPVRHA